MKIEDINYVLPTEQIAEKDFDKEKWLQVTHRGLQPLLFFVYSTPSQNLSLFKLYLPFADRYRGCGFVRWREHRHRYPRIVQAAHLGFLGREQKPSGAGQNLLHGATYSSGCVRVETYLVEGTGR